MSAPKGNKYAVGNKGGRPPLFKSVAELQAKVDEYFDTMPDKRKTIVGDKVIDVPVCTISGLAYFLGFVSRDSFYDYANNEVFSDTIKSARLRIERMYEQNLFFNNPTGSIFALKNMGWSDKQEIEHSGDVVTGIDYIVPNEVKD